MKPDIRRKFLELTGFTSSGIAVPFDEIPAETWDLNQTMLYKTGIGELVMRVVLDLGKIQFKVPSALVSDTDQSTWQMAQTLKIVAANDCIVKRIEVQTPAALLAKMILTGKQTKSWHPLGLPETTLKSNIEQNYSFPNGLIAA